MDHSKRTRWSGSSTEQSAELLRRYQDGERDFRALSFSDLKLKGAVLRGADFSGSSISGSLEGADLREAHFTDAEFDHANLSRARLEHARFQGAGLFQSSLDEASLQEADFTRAHLSEVYLKRADLTNARFVHANLTGDVYLEGATLTGAVFDEANLIDLLFPTGTWPRMSFRGALHAQARPLKLPPGYTPEAEGMRLVGPGVVLAGLDLRGFRFNGLDLSEADFTGADLRGARFANVVLKGARFKGANLDGASFDDLRDGALDGSDFSGAHGKPRSGDLAHIAEGNTSSHGMQLLFPSPALAEIVGSKGLSRTDAMKKVHAYVKEHNLSAGKGYSADEKLKRITGKEQFTLIELTRSVNQHLHKTRAQSSAGGGEDPAE